jgi:hypothetical protein
MKRTTPASAGDRNRTQLVLCLLLRTDSSHRTLVHGRLGPDRHHPIVGSPVERSRSSGPDPRHHPAGPAVRARPIAGRGDVPARPGVAAPSPGRSPQPHDPLTMASLIEGEPQNECTYDTILINHSEAVGNGHLRPVRDFPDSLSHRRVCSSGPGGPAQGLRVSLTP